MSASGHARGGPRVDGPLAEGRTLVIACGALARELKTVARVNGLHHLDVEYLPAALHNQPERIAPAVRDKLRDLGTGYDRILCVYGDCGTAGALDRVLSEAGAERIEGAHCYGFLTGQEAFDSLMDEEPGSFFLTDFLVRHFERLVMEGLGLDRFPHLLLEYFGHYRRVVHLVQVPDARLTALARAAAARLGLAFASRLTGLHALSQFLAPPGVPGEAGP